MEEKKIRNNQKKDLVWQFIMYWLPFFMWLLVIFIFSSFPTTSASEIHWKDFFIKKTAHVVEYAILTVFLYRALTNSGAERKNAGYYSVLFSIFYGMSDEFHQSFTPGRDPKLRDVLFDTIGSVGGIYLVWRMLPKAPKKLRILAKKLEIT